LRTATTAATNDSDTTTSNTATGIATINTAKQAAIRCFYLPNCFYSADRIMIHGKQGFILLNNLIRFPKDFVFLVTQK
jgi:hypothetical protein